MATKSFSSVFLSIVLVTFAGACVDQEELLDAEIEAEEALDAEIVPFVGNGEPVTEELMEQAYSEMNSIDHGQGDDEQNMTTCNAAGTCDAMDVHVYGSGCSPKPYNGIYWDGSNCRGAFGCNCDGADCGNLFENSSAGADCCVDTYYNPCN